MAYEQKSRARVVALALSAVLVALATVLGAYVGAPDTKEPTNRHRTTEPPKNNPPPVTPPGKPDGRGLGGTFASPAHVPYQETGTEDPRPNILLITTDDQALSDLRWMPKTRKWLADQGITFRNMLSPHPLCCPARAEIVTGQFAQNNGVHTNSGPYGGLSALIDPNNTLAWWLQSDHYQTAMIGKYLNNYKATDGVPQGWDHWNAATHNSLGYYDYVLYNNGTPKLYGHDSDAMNSSNVIAADTQAQISAYAQDERPFFIWSSYYAPHGLCGETGGCANPPDSETKYQNKYTNTESPHMNKPSYNEADVTDKPTTIRGSKPVDDTHSLYLFRQRIRALATVDDGIDATMRTLKATGELDNTIVMFTSDNGYLIGEHRYEGKVMPYEESIRVPLLMRGPGIPAGETRGQLVTTVDLTPTILALTGTRPRRVQDGRNIMGFAASKTTARHDDTILIQAGGMPKARNPEPWMYRGVRTTQYTYVEWEDGFVELYDLDADPYQMRNVADLPAYSTVVTELHRRTGLLKNCAGATCRQAFGPVPDIVSGWWNQLGSRNRR